MERTQAIEIIREKLPERRFLHTLGVVETAKELAVRFGADVEKADMAAIFHDVAKYEAADFMRKMIIENRLSQDLLEFDQELWHAPVGALLVQRDYGVMDEEILDAIRFHTTGRMGMSVLEKVVFLADYIEPGRKTPRVDECRELAKTDLDAAIIFSYQSTIQYLLSQRKKIYPETILAYNDFIERRNVTR